MACERTNCAAQLRKAASVKANAKRQLGGTITFEAAGSPPASGFSGFRIMPVPLGAVAALPGFVHSRHMGKRETGQGRVSGIAPHM